SAAAGRLGRWSLLLRAADERPLVLDRTNYQEMDFLAELAGRQRLVGAGPGDRRFPFCGGWFLYLSYELAGQLERGLELPPAADGLPVALAQRCRSALLHDHQNDRFWLVAEEQKELDAALAEIHAAGAEPALSAAALPELALSADEGGDFVTAVARIRAYIRAGDVVQVNLARGWQARADAPIDPVSVYQALARANPAPFAALAKLPGGSVVSSSPERL